MTLVMAGPRRALNVAVSLAAVATAIVLAPQVLIGLAIAATIVASIEVLWPLHTGSRRSRAALVTDLTHAIGNRYLVVALFIVLVGAVGPAAAGLVPDGVRTAVHGLPPPLLVAVVFVLTDLANYGGHVAMHRIPVLWRLHAVHHSSERLDWLATARVHPVDLALSITMASLPTYALGFTVDEPWLLTFLFLYPFLAHANAHVRLPVLDRVIVSPELHHWHHAADRAAHNHNYGAILSVWDRLFGTAYEPGGFPTDYGTGDRALADADYLGHLVAPLARKRVAQPSATETPTSAAVTSTPTRTTRHVETR
jgi:sterol desaturase/sphingolipid hydroxylase (fatty acid hydroxylase superfamily)